MPKIEKAYQRKMEEGADSKKNGICNLDFGSKDPRKFKQLYNFRKN